MALAAAAIVCALGGEAKADAISLASFSISGPAPMFSFSQFDPSLGTLNRVSVSITGALSIQVIPEAPNIVDGFGDVGPYPAQVGAGLSFTALSQSLLGGFSTVVDPAPTVGLGLSDGTMAPYQIVIPLYADSFTFNATTDLIGFALGTLGDAEKARLSDFIANPYGTPLELVTLDAQLLAATIPGVITSVSFAGSGLIEYDYTPAPPVTSVPDSTSTLVLLTIALALLATCHQAQARLRPVRVIA
jgi:hypothetical protein